MVVEEIGDILFVDVDVCVAFVVVSVEIVVCFNDVVDDGFCDDKIEVSFCGGVVVDFKVDDSLLLVVVCLFWEEDENVVLPDVVNGRHWE